MMLLDLAAAMWKVQLIVCVLMLHVSQVRSKALESKTLQLKHTGVCTYDYEVSVHTSRGSESTESNGYQIHALVDLTPVSRDYGGNVPSHLIKLDIREPRLRRVRYGRVLSNHPINEEFEEQLSKPFYFRQEDHGAVLDVLFPKADETPEVAAFKKGVVGAFQLSLGDVHKASTYHSHEQDDSGVYLTKYSVLSANDTHAHLHRTWTNYDYRRFADGTPVGGEHKLQSEHNSYVHLKDGRVDRVHRTTKAYFRPSKGHPRADNFKGFQKQDQDIEMSTSGYSKLTLRSCSDAKQRRSKRSVADEDEHMKSAKSLSSDRLMFTDTDKIKWSEIGGEKKRKTRPFYEVLRCFTDKSKKEREIGDCSMELHYMVSNNEDTFQKVIRLFQDRSHQNLTSWSVYIAALVGQGKLQVQDHLAQAVKTDYPRPLTDKEFEALLVGIFYLPKGPIHPQLFDALVELTTKGHRGDDIGVTAMLVLAGLTDRAVKAGYNETISNVVAKMIHNSYNNKSSFYHPDSQEYETYLRDHIWAFGNLGHQSGLPVILDHITHDNSGIRSAVISAMRKLPSEHTDHHLMNALYQDEHNDVKAAVVEVFIDRHQHLSDSVTRGLEHALWHAPESETLDSSIQELLENHGNHPKAVYLRTKRSSIHRSKRALFPFLRPREFALGPSKRWVKTFGGKWLGAESVIQFVNQVKLRIGIFGGSFEVNLNNLAFIRAHILKFGFDVVRGKAAFKASASFKNDFPKDLIHSIADAGDDLIKQFDSIASVIAEQINKVKGKLAGYLPLDIDKFLNFVNKLIQFVQNLVQPLRPINFIRNVIEFAKDVLRRVKDWKWLLGKIKKIQVTFSKLTVVDDIFREVIAALDKILDIVNSITKYLPHNLPGPFNIKKLLEFLRSVSVDLQMDTIEDYFRSLGFSMPSGFRLQLPFKFSMHFSFSLEKFQAVAIKLLRFANTFLDLSSMLDFLEGLRFPTLRLPNLDLRFPPMQGGSFNFGLKFDWRVHLKFDVKLRSPDFLKFIKILSNLGDFFKQFRYPEFDLEQFFSEIMPGKTLDLTKVFSELFQGGHHANFTSPAQVLQGLLENVINLLNSKFSNISAIADITDFFEELGPVMAQFLEKNGEKICRIYKLTLNSSQEFKAFGENVEEEGIRVLQSVENVTQNVLTELLNVTNLIDSLINEIEQNFTSAAKGFVSKSLQGLSGKLKDIQTLADDIIDFANGTASKVDGACTKAATFSATVIDTVQDNAREAITELTAFIGPLATKIKSFGADLKSAVTKVETWYEDNLAVRVGKISRVAQVISDFLSILNTKKGFLKTVRDVAARVNGILKHLRNLPDYANRARKTADDVMAFADRAQNYKDRIQNLDIRKKFGIDFDERLKNVCTKFRNITTDALNKAGSYDVVREVNLFFEEKADKLISKGVSKFREIKEPIREIQEELTDIKSMVRELMEVLTNLRPFTKNFSPILSTAGKLPDCRQMKVIFTKSTKPCVQKALVVGKYVLDQYKDFRKEIEVLNGMVPETWRTFKLQKCVKGGTCISKAFIDQAKVIKDKVDMLKDKFEEASGYSDMLQTCKLGVDNITAVVDTVKLLIEQFKNFTLKDDVQKVQTVLQKITGRSIKEGGGGAVQKRSIKDVKERFERIVDYIQKAKDMQKKMEDLVENSFKAMRSVYNDAVVEHVQALEDVRAKIKRSYDLWQKTKDINNVLQGLETVTRSASDYADNLKGVTASFSNPIVDLLAETGDLSNFVKPYLDKYTTEITETVTKVNGFLDKITDFLNAIQLRQRGLDPSAYKPWQEISYCSEEVCLRSLRRSSSLYLKTIFTWKFPHLDDLSSMDKSGRWLTPGLFDDYKVEGIAQLSKNEMILGMHGVSSNKEQASLLVVTNFVNGVKKIIQLGSQGNPSLVKIGGVAIARDVIWISDKKSNKIHSIKKASVTSSFSSSKPSWVGISNTVSVEGAASSVSYDERSNVLWVTDGEAGKAYSYKLSATGNLGAAGLAPDRVIHIGQNSQGMTIVRQFNTEYVCVSKCALISGYQCKLEFHDVSGGDETGENTLVRVVRTPSGLESVNSVDSEVIALAFSSGTFAEKDAIELTGGDFEDRYFRIRLPILKLTFGIHENCLFFRVMNSDILRPRRLFPIGDMICGTTRKRSVTQELLESDVYSEQLEEVHRTNNRVRREASDLGSCLTLFRGNVIRGYQKFFPEYSQIIIVFGIPVRLFAGAGGFYSVDYQGQVCMQDKIFRLGLIPGAWISVYAGAAVSLFIVEAGITIEAVLLETYLVPELRIKIDKWPLKACIELKLHMTPLRIRVWLWYRFRLCIRIRCKLFGCSIKIRWCSKKTLAEWWWSARSIDRTLFNNCQANVDRTPPIAGTCTARQAADKTYFVQWHGFREDTKIKSYQVRIGSIPGSGDDYSSWVGTSLSLVVTDLSIMHGRDVHFSIKATNDGRLDSRLAYCPKFQAKRKGPQIRYVFDGVTEGKDVDYQSDDYALGMNFAIKSNVENIVHIKWGISTSSDCTLDEAESNVIPMTQLGDSSSIQISGLDLEHGKTYFTRLHVMNSFGLKAVMCSDGTLIDTTPPIPGNFQDGTGEGDVQFLPSVRRVRGKFDRFLDPESPIVKYEWKIVRNDSDIDVTSFVNIPLTQQTPLMDGLSLQAGSSYRLVLRGTNAAGLQTTVGTNGFIPDPTPPECEGRVIDVIDEDDTNDADFVRELKSIQAKWSCMDPESNIYLQLVGVGTYPGGDDVRRFENLEFLPHTTNVNKMIFVSFSEIEIRARERYHVTVKIINGARLKKTLTSDGILIDTTPPTVAAQYIRDGAEGNDKNFTSERFTFTAHWEQAFADAESGIAEYRVALGSSSGLTDVLGLKNVGSQTSASLPGIVLRGGQRYFVTVVGCNGVGMCVNASSNGAVVDFVPPHAGKVITGLHGPPLLYQWMTKAVWARWNWCLSDEKRVSGLFNQTQCSNDSFFDVHSGIATFGISVVSLKTDNLLASPKKVGRVRHTGRSINLEEGIYSVVIEAKDRAGVTARGLSNTFIVDSTPPVVSYVQHGYLGETVEYTNTPFITFKAYLEIEDDLSKVTAYKIGVGSYSGADDVMTFHTTTLTYPVSSLRTNWTSQNPIPIDNNRRYFITVWAINSAGLFNIKSSTPLLSDFDPPNNGIVMDGWGLTDAQYQSYSAIYRAHWYGFTDFSGIEQVRLGLSSHLRSDHCDVRKEEVIPNSANYHVLFGLNLTSGQKYFACVKLVDHAGNSARFHSNGFLVDTSPPFPGVVYDGRPAKELDVQVESSILRASWLNFTEKETKIVSYQLAFGSLPGSQDAQEFTNVGLVNTAASSRLKVSELTSGQRYYATVIAYNVLGMPSAEISSDGVMVDFTPPVFRRPVRDGLDPSHDLRFTADGFLSATWSCEDLETSLQSVHIGFGLQPGDSGVMKFTDVPIQQTLFTINRTLHLGYRYFATVKCVNKVGLQATSFSNGVVYDDSPPRPLYVRDGDYQGPNTNVTVAFKFVDAESGISKFQVKVWGTDNTGIVLDIHGPYVFDGNVAVISLQTRQELVNGRKYVVNVTAINGAGFKATVESDGFVIDGTPPVCSSVWDGKEGYENDIEYAPSQSKRIISWICHDKESPIVRYRFAVRNLGTGDPVIPFYALKSALNSSGFAIITGGGRLTPKYEDGHMYAVGIEVTNAAGGRAVNWTNGVLIDSTPPVVTTLKLRFDPKTDSLAAEWTVKDGQSGIKSLAWGIGTAPELNDVKNFTNLSLSTTSLSIANVPLELGTTYFLSLFTVNKAGLSSRTASNGVVIDRTPPNHGTVIAQYVFPKNYDRNRNDVPGSSFVVTWTGFTDPESGIKIMSWAVGKDEEAVKNLAGDLYAEVVTDDSVGGIVIENQTLVGNETYFACIRARNGAGLDTTDCSLGMLVVLGKFSPGVVNDGPAASASDIDFQLDDRTIWVHWDGFKDPVFGISRYDWCIRDQPPNPSGSDVCKWPFTEVLHLKTSAHRFYNLTLLHGKKYYVTVKAENSRGESVSSSSDGVVVDRTPPIGKAVQVSPASGKQTLYVTSPSAPVVTWSMDDPESGMSHFLVGVGSFPFQDDLLTFHRVDSLSRSLDLDLINFTLYEGLIFYVTVTGVNMLGLETSITSQQVVVDWTPPESGEIADGNFTSPITQRFVDVDYQTEKGILSAHWHGFQDAESDVVEYSWCIGTTQGSCDVQMMTSADLHTSAHHQIDLEEGQRYFFTIEATNAAGLKESAFSDGVTIDTSPPLIENVVYDVETDGTADQDDQSGLSVLSSGLCSGSGNEPCDLKQKDARLLSFSWEMPYDVESGISSVVWCAGTKVDSCDIISWAHVDPEETVVRHDFSSPLVSGTVVVIKVMAVNGAGMTSTAVSKALLIDSTPPAVGIVIVGSSPEIKYFKKDEPLIADWSGFIDRESSISHFKWAVCHAISKDDCVTPYVNVGLQTAVENTVLDIKPGVSHVLVVRAYNKVGLFSDAVSNQFIVDASTPSAGTVYDGVNEQKDIEFQSSTNEISANWLPFTDTNGRIANYEMCVGTELESCDVNDFVSLGVVLQGSISGLNLTHNRRYFATIRATNDAGYAALATSNGVRVDSTTPLGGEVRDGQTLSDLNYQSDNTFIYANWDEFQDSESDVVKYSWCAGTGKGICDIIVETDVGDRTSVGQQIYPPLATGMTAYVTVSAYNGAGAVTRKSSDGIRVDNTAPVISNVLDLQLGLSLADRDFLTAKDAYCTSWDVEDSESGLAKNAVSVCSAINTNDCLVRNQDAENRTIICIANVEFVEGVRYVTKIRSQNNVGRTSELTSDGFVFDSTPPVIGEITHIENKNLSLYDTTRKATHSQISVQWDGFWDKESSVRKYFICVGTQPGHCDVMNFTDIGNSIIYTSQNLVLVQEEMYFVSLKAENQAGLMSEEKSSDGVFVDKTGPINEGKILDGNKEGVDIDIQRSRTDIAAHWSGFIDLESDVIQLVWCAGSFPGSCDIVIETKISPMITSVHKVLNTPIKNGARYFVTVIATNGAGVVTSLTSDGVIVDDTRPSPGTVINGDGFDVDYLYGDDDVSAHWSSFEDKESGIEYYEVALCDVRNASSCPQPFARVGQATNVTLTGLDLESGAQYSVIVRAVNFAGLKVDASSRGFTVDFTPPTATKPKVGAGAHPVEYQTNLTQMVLSWPPFTDSESGITKYEVCVTTAPEYCTVSNFINIGLSTDYTVSGLHLTHGETYYAIVRGTNGIGMFSETSTGGVLIDVTPPILKDLDESINTTESSLMTFAPTTGSNANNSVPQNNDIQSSPHIRFSCSEELLTANWDEFEDFESGLLRYEWCVGTNKSQCDVLALRSVGDKARGAAIVNRLPSGAGIFATVYAVNGANLKTRLVSERCKVISVAPKLVEVIDIPGLNATNVTDIDWKAMVQSLSLRWEIIGMYLKDISRMRIQVAVTHASSNLSLPRIVTDQSWNGEPFAQEFVDVLSNQRHVTIRSGKLQPWQRYRGVVRVQNEGDIYMEASSDGVRIEPSPPPERSLSIRDKAAEQEHLRWLPNLHLPHINEDTLDPEIKYVSLPKDLELIVQSGSNETGNVTSFILDHDLFSPTKHFMVVIKRVTSDTNNTNTTETSKTMKVIPGFSNPEGPCCAESPLDPPSVFSDLHLKATLPAQQFGASLAVLQNDFLAVGSVEKAFVVSLKNTTANHFTVPNTHLGSGARPITIASHQNKTAFLLNSEEVLVYDSTVDDFGNLRLHNLAVIRKCKDPLNDGCSANDTWVNRMGHVIALHEHVIAITGTISVTNASVVGVFRNQRGMWTLQRTLGQANNDPYFGHSLSFNQRSLAVAGVEGRNSCIYIYKIDPLGLLTKFCFAEDKNLTAPLSIHLTENDTLVVASKRSRSLIVFQLNASDMSYIELCRYSVAMDEDLSGSLDVTARDEGFLVALGIQTRQGQDGVQLIGFYGLYTKNPSRHRVGECINLGRVVARESGLRLDDGTPRAIVYFTGNTVLFGTPSVVTWPGSGERSGTGRVYMATHCPVDHVRIRNSQINKFSSVSCAPCERGRKSFGGFVELCSVCDGSACLAPQSDDPFSFKSNICSDVSCRSLSSINNLTNGIDIHLMNGSFFIPGPENVYAVELVETTRADLSTRSLSESFLIDPTAPEPGVVYDGVGSDQSTNCSENSTFGEDSQCSTRSFTDTDIDYTNNTREIHARWIDFLDNESDIVEYFWCVGSQPMRDDISSCESTGMRPNGSHYGLNLKQSESYYVTVIACNGARRCSAAYSDGVTIDTTPPVMNYVRDGIMGPDMDFQVFVDIIFAYFAARDEESGVTSYEVAWGTAPGLTDIKEFEEVTNTTIWLAKFKDNALERGKKYYATVRATNAAGLLSDRLSSNGIVVGKSEYIFDNSSSASFFFDTVNVNENGSRKDGGVGKTYGTLTVPEGAVEGQMKLRSFSLDDKALNENKTEEGPVSDPKITKPKQFMLGNYSFMIKALDPVNNTIQEGYQFAKPITLSMFYDVDNLVKANKKHVNKEVTKEDIDPVLYLWDPENKTWFDASLTCPEPWSHVNRTIKLLMVEVCHLTQFAFFWSFDAQNGLILLDKNNTMYNNDGVIEVSLKKQVTKLELPVRRSKGSQGNIGVRWSLYENSSTDPHNLLWPASGEISMTDSQWNDSFVINVANDKEETTEHVIWVQLDKTTGGAVLASHDQITAKILIASNQKSSYTHWLIIGVCVGVLLVFVVVVVLVWRKCRQQRQSAKVKGGKLTDELPHLSGMPTKEEETPESMRSDAVKLETLASVPSTPEVHGSRRGSIDLLLFETSDTRVVLEKESKPKLKKRRSSQLKKVAADSSEYHSPIAAESENDLSEEEVETTFSNPVYGFSKDELLWHNIAAEKMHFGIDGPAAEEKVGESYSTELTEKECLDVDNPDSFQDKKTTQASAMKQDV